MRVSVTFSRCFAWGLHSPIVNRQRQYISAGIAIGGSGIASRRSTRPRIAEGTRHKEWLPFEEAGGDKRGAIVTSECE